MIREYPWENLHIKRNRSALPNSLINYEYCLLNLKTLVEKKVISKSIKKVKIFGDTSISSKVTVEGIAVSKGAKKSIEDAGGKILEINTNKDNQKEVSTK